MTNRLLILAVLVFVLASCQVAGRDNGCNAVADCPVHHVVAYFTARTVTIDRTLFGEYHCPLSTSVGERDGPAATPSEPIPAASTTVQ